MNRHFLSGNVVLALLIGSLPICLLPIAHAAGPDHGFSIGRGIADVTGPPVGMQMWGFVREDQISEGIHTRLFSRAFVFADRETDKRLAFVSVDLGSVTHAIHAKVVDRLRDRFGDAYSLENVILSATHTHGGPGGYWHYGVGTPIGGPFYKQHFDAIVEGIVESIAQAHADLQPGSILINRGTVEGAGVNRSMAAYENNPEEERARYDSDTDKEMTLLKLADVSGVIGIIDWFASHPTAMTYDNRLISGDHKGHASALFEAMRGEGFVAAFAQSNAGDVTPNLNLDNTGPGENYIETTRIIAERQFDVARELFDNATERITGEIDYRQTFVNFAYLPVGGEFTGNGPQTTCPSAYGYAFAAGSTEDGGGHPLFKEGMKRRNLMIDATVKQQFGMPDPTERCRECHEDKAILFAAGELDPPGQAQILPLTLARIGQLTLVCVPAEFTTMAGRRLRETVAAVLGDNRGHIVLVGYANDYGGYVTTREEYAMQHYEGGHTLFGPWTLAAYQQEFTRLARAMVERSPVEPGPAPVDMRGRVPVTLIAAPADTLPAKAAFGAIARKPKRSYRAGDTVRVSFWSGDPRNDFKTGNTYLAVERDESGNWVTVATDTDWSTTCRWVRNEKVPTESKFLVTWDIPQSAAPGNYRIMHRGNFLDSAGKVQRFAGESRMFKVR